MSSRQEVLRRTGALLRWLFPKGGRLAGQRNLCKSLTVARLWTVVYDKSSV